MKSYRELLHGHIIIPPKMTKKESDCNKVRKPQSNVSNNAGPQPPPVKVLHCALLPVSSANNTRHKALHYIQPAHKALHYYSTQSTTLLQHTKHCTTYSQHTNHYTTTSHKALHYIQPAHKALHYYSTQSTTLLPLLLPVNK